MLPYGYSAGNLFEYESGGNMRQNILMVNFNTRFSRNVSLFGNYSVQPLPGPARHPDQSVQLRSGLGTLFARAPPPLPVGGLGGRAAQHPYEPFVTLQSGAPYDVVLGRDIYGDTLKNARPAFATAACGPMPIVTPLGDFCINPFPGATSNLVPRNYLTGAGLISFNVRVARTFGFGAKRRRRQRANSRRLGR